MHIQEKETYFDEKKKSAWGSELDIHESLCVSGILHSLRR